MTALALGIPSRFVHNEAHAWVEVFDGVRWHRVDLGGAADHLDSSDVGRIAYLPPRDPFEWPAGAQSGQAMADRARALAVKDRAEAAPPATQVPAATTAAEEPRAEPEDRRPRALVTIHLGDSDARRGNRIALSGRIQAGGSPCAEARVDLFLDPKAGVAQGRVPLGTLVTNADGRYAGHVVVPYTVSPGDYDVRASTPGNPTCGEGDSL